MTSRLGKPLRGTTGKFGMKRVLVPDLHGKEPSEEIMYERACARNRGRCHSIYPYNTGNLSLMVASPEKG